MMMNSDWMNVRAENMAKQIVNLNPTPDAAIREAFERVFLKQPTESDTESAMRFIGVKESAAEKSAAEKSWRNLFVDYCHVLINSNSFLHLE